MEQAYEEDGGYYTHLTVKDSVWGYTTSGGNVWAVDILTGYLHYEGSRWGFLNGCNAVRIIRHQNQIFAHFYPGIDHQEMWDEVQLVDWTSSIPGNPGPFSDWIGIIQEQKELTYPITLGEWIEAKFWGWNLRTIHTVDYAIA